jgi:uncharacterized protein YaiL (DUF2058 family)
MKRCIECASHVTDRDQTCTACRVAEWQDQQRQAVELRERVYALEAYRDAYKARKRKQREAINVGVASAVFALLAWALIANLPAALRYETVTKPAMLKANGVK